jgi:hypothetical protein
MIREREKKNKKGKKRKREQRNRIDNNVPLLISLSVNDRQDHVINIDFIGQ